MTHQVHSRPFIQISALWLSRIFHPFILPVPTLFFVMYLTGLSLLESSLWTSLFLIIVILPATAYILWNVRSGRFSDKDVSNREERKSLYKFGLVSVSLFITVLYLFDAPWVVLASMWSVIFAVIVAGLVNRFVTKVSIHTIAAVGCTTILGLISPSIGLIVGLAALTLSWARVQLKHHTLRQVILGWIIAIFCTVVMFQIYKLG